MAAAAGGEVTMLLEVPGPPVEVEEAADEGARSDPGSGVSELSAYSAVSVTAGPSSVAASTIGGRPGGGKKKKKRKQ